MQVKTQNIKKTDSSGKYSLIKILFRKLAKISFAKKMFSKIILELACGVNYPVFSQFRTKKT